MTSNEFFEQVNKIISIAARVTGTLCEDIVKANRSGLISGGLNVATECYDTKYDKIIIIPYTITSETQLKLKNELDSEFNDSTIYIKYFRAASLNECFSPDWLMLLVGNCDEDED